MDPVKKNKANKSVSKPGTLNNRNDHDAPEVIGEKDDHSDEELITEVERNNSLNEEKENNNRNPGKITNNETNILEKPERPGESQDGSI